MPLQRLIKYLEDELKKPDDRWNDYTFISSREIKGFIRRLLIFIKENYGEDDLK